MAARIAVVTDLLSEGHFYPLWHGYYGGLFGAANLFVVTYGDAAPLATLKLGGVMRLPVGYSNDVRAQVMTDLVALLLGAYDVVIRVVADEILVVDPRVAANLRDYIEDTDRPYYTARGFDVVQTPEEAPLRPGGAVLAQRQVAYQNTAGNKTCITRVPVHWSAGFHWCSCYPECGPLFMLHLKRIDVDWQMAWYEEFGRALDANPAVPEATRAKYRPDRDTILQYHRGVSSRRRVAGIENWYRDEVQAQFFDAITYRPRDDLYVGDFRHDHALCELPAEWRALL